MDPGGRWRNLPSGPSLKHLTDSSYGIPREQQKPALQELTRAHVESFNYAVSEGLSHAVQVSLASSQPFLNFGFSGASSPCYRRVKQRGLAARRMGCGVCEALEKEEGEVSEAWGLEEGRRDPGDGGVGHRPSAGLCRGRCQ